MNGVSTTKPNSGDTEAVILPVDILTESSVIAERGISNNPLPLPLYIEAVKVPSILVSPINFISAGTYNASTTLIVPAILPCNWQL